MLKQWICAVLVVGLMTVGVARADDVSRRAKAEELLNLMDMKKNTDQMFEMMRQSVSMQVKQASLAAGKPAAGVKASDESMKIFDLVQGELSWEKMKDRYITLYAETFTEEDIQGIIDFYKSPAGVAFLAKQPELMKRTMALNQQLMAEIMPKMQALIAESHKGPGAKPTPAKAAAPVQPTVPVTKPAPATTP
jgi:hypothetical protein